MSTSTMFKNYMILAKQRLDENASIHADIRSKMTTQLVVRNRSYKFVLMTDVSILFDTSKYITLDTHGQVHCLQGNQLHSHMNNMKVLVEIRKVTPTHFHLQHWKNDKNHRLDLIKTSEDDPDFFDSNYALLHDKTFDEAIQLHYRLERLWSKYEKIDIKDESSSLSFLEDARILQKNMDKLQKLYIEMKKYLTGFEEKPELMKINFPPQIHPIFDHIDNIEGNEELLRFIEYRKCFYKISKSKVYSEVVQISDILEMFDDSLVAAPTNFIEHESANIIVEEQEVYDIDVLADIIIQREFKHYIDRTEYLETFHTLDTVKETIQKFHLFVANQSNDQEQALIWQKTLQDIHQVLTAVVEYTNDTASSFDFA